MKNNEKFDFIRDKLVENTEAMPLSLKRENMLSSLDNISQRPNVRRLSAKKWVSLAASFAVLLISVFAVGLIKNSNLKTKSEPLDTENGEYTGDNKAPQTEKEDDYGDIVEYFKARFETVRYDVFNKDESMVVEDYEIAVPSESVTQVAPESFNSSLNSTGTQKDESVSYGQTNTQVSGIDEADIIKNDGTYLYILRSSRRADIYRAADLKLISEIVLPDTEGKYRSAANEMYLSQGRLVIVSTVREASDEGGSCDSNVSYGWSMPAYFGTGNTQTQCLVYDVSDVNAPKLIFTHTQSGNYNTSRLIGNTLYTVTRYTVLDYMNTVFDADESKNDASQEKYVETCIPQINGKKISRSNIDFIEGSNATGYAVVSSCDITKASPEGTGYAYLGNVDDVYCTADTLYMSSVLYTYDMEQKDLKKLKNEFGIEDGNYTGIYAVSLSQSKISFKNQGYVRGEFINQFAMDEYNGYFRCATTYRDKNWNAVSSVIILDKDFKEVSRVDNLANNEEIKSVRFMGDIAYVVTFRNTDPLFVLDLSDPTAPKKDGEVKLPGFSAYLHPIGSDYIVGVGFGGDSAGTDNSVQVTLFDVKDKKHPTVSSSCKIDNVYTQINNADYDNNSFKTFMYYPEKNIIGIPVERWNDGELIREYLLFKAEDGKLELLNQFRHEKVNYYDDEIIVYNSTDISEYENFPEFFTGTYIDTTLYTVSDKKICAFDMESAEKTAEKELGK